jgi:hypothetical protein
MTTPERRRKKPIPARTRPLRGFSNVLRMPDAPEPAAREARSFMPLIERTVRTGYELVDEYVQAGRAAAEQHRERQPKDPGRPIESERVADRLAEYTTHLAMAGLEYLQSLSRTPGQAPPQGAAPPFASSQRPRTNGAAGSSRATAAAEASHEPQRSPERRVQVSVEARVPVRAILELSANMGSGAVRAQAARRTGPGEGGAVERGIGVEIRATKRTTSASVRVASKVAPGSYRSLLVLAANNLPCGHLTLQVLPRPSK